MERGSFAPLVGKGQSEWPPLPSVGRSVGHNADAGINRAPGPGMSLQVSVIVIYSRPGLP